MSELEVHPIDTAVMYLGLNGGNPQHCLLTPMVRLFVVFLNQVISGGFFIQIEYYIDLDVSIRYTF
jgi:hypothetical protein